MNIIVLSGRVATPIRVRNTTTGSQVANFIMAVPYSFAKTGKNEQNATEFLPIVAWDKVAKNCQQYLEKGSRLSVKGHLHRDEYTDKEGKTIRSVVVVAESIEYGEYRKKQSDEKKESQQYETDSYNNIPDEEIPF